MPDDRSVTEAETEQDELEEIDNPIERLKLLSETTCRPSSWAAPPFP